MDFKDDCSVATYSGEISETKGAIDDYASDYSSIKSTDTVESLNIQKTDFQSYYYDSFYESVLEKSLKNLWNSYKYNEKYIAFLLNMSSEEEFMQYVEESAPEMEKIEEKQIFLAAHIIHQVIDEPISSIDLSTFFCVDPIDIELAINKFSHTQPLEVVSDEQSE